MTQEGVAIRRELRSWYVANGRHGLPWRLTRDPYAVLVSEVMLQQTQVSRVLPYFEAWMARWPTAESLAAASTADVIRAWAGLGYNSRALRLHATARTVAATRFPTSLQGLKALPGIGPYTAAAVASFAFGHRVAVVDTNIARVLGRILGGQSAAKPDDVKAAAASLLPARGVRDHNLALMDMGALVCTAANPRCDDCPLRSHCAWRAAGYPQNAAARAPAMRFEDTARFARGRIVDALRTATSVSDVELRERLPAHHRPRLATYLAALERDGLVARVGSGEWALPPAQPSTTAG